MEERSSYVIGVGKSIRDTSITNLFGKIERISLELVKPPVKPTKNSPKMQFVDYVFTIHFFQRGVEYATGYNIRPATSEEISANLLRIGIENV